MKTFIADIFPKIQRYSRKLDKLTVLINTHWVLIGQDLPVKIVYFFRDNKELIVSINGNVEKAKWDYLGENSLLIDKADGSYLFNHGFLDDHVLALRLDGSREYAVFVNEGKFLEHLTSLTKVTQFLQGKYHVSSLKHDIRPVAKKNEIKRLPEILDRQKTTYTDVDIVEGKRMSKKLRILFIIFISIAIIIFIKLYLAGQL